MTPEERELQWRAILDEHTIAPSKPCATRTMPFDQVQGSVQTAQTAMLTTVEHISIAVEAAASAMAAQRTAL